MAANEVLKKIDLGKILTLTKENEEVNNNKKDKKKHANVQIDGRSCSTTRNSSSIATRTFQG